MNKLLTILFVALALHGFATDPVGERVRRGNVIREELPSEDEGLYLGNGRFGAALSSLGLTERPLSHLQYWGRFGFTSAIEHTPTTADYLLPSLELSWEKAPESVRDYHQEQDFYDGVLRTSFVGADGRKVEVTGWFDSVEKDLAGFELNLSTGDFPIVLSAKSGFQIYPFVFRDTVEQTLTVIPEGDNHRLELRYPASLNEAAAVFYLYSSAPVEVDGQTVRILPGKGRNKLYIRYGAPVTPADRENSLKRSIRGWHDKWAATGWLDLPEPEMHKVWVRSMAYLLSSYDDTETGLIQPTNGLSGYPFPFHFVQDLEYIAPMLMMTGHGDIVESWVEKFAGEIPQMQSYAKHLWPASEGIYPPWELPFGPIEDYHAPTVPVAFCYEPHNVGYLCRMAKEAGDFKGDVFWTERYVKPLIVECCRFYLSACTRGEDGQWHLSWYPSIGQDEAGGRNKTDYLCSLYSAKYCFQTAVEMGLDADGKMAGILTDGLAFDSLLSDRGTWHTCRGADDFGIQKHPVQLDGLSYFPVEAAPLPTEAKAYALRHDITNRAREPYFFGWTLGQFLLSASNMKDSSGWLEDWSKMIPSGYTDPDWIQIRETSRNTGASFYVTTHAMIGQSLVRNYVNDYWGTLDIAACPVSEGTVRFGNIATRLGVTVSGEAGKDGVKLTVVSPSDRELTVNGEKVSLKKGENRLEIPVYPRTVFTILSSPALSDTLSLPLTDLQSYLEATVPGVEVRRVEAGGIDRLEGHVIVLLDRTDPAFSKLCRQYRLPAAPGEWNSFRISSFRRKEDRRSYIYFLEGADLWGKQYAVYDFAERLLGVRYLKPDLDYVRVDPGFHAVPVETGLQKPDFKWRGLYPWHYNYNGRGLKGFCDINARFVEKDWRWFRQLCDWMVKNKQNAVLWFDDVFSHENISGQFPAAVRDYYAFRGVRQVLGLGWASNEDLTTGGDWKRKICLDKEGKTVEDASWKKSICPMTREYEMLLDINFGNLKLDHPENYIGALIGYGENTWASRERGVDCVLHDGVPSSTLMNRDLDRVAAKFREAGLGNLPLGFVTSTHSIRPGNPFETDALIENLPSNAIFTMHTYQQTGWTQFERLYDRIARRNREEHTDIKVFHIGEVAFLCGTDIPLLKPSILRRRSEHFNTLPRENTIGHLATLNTTQYLYWYNTYRMLRWQWHKDDTNWEAENRASFSDLFGEENGLRLSEVFDRLTCLEYVLPYAALDSLVNTPPDLLPPRAWGRYNPATHPARFGFLLWAAETDPGRLDGACASVEAILRLDRELSAMDSPLYRDEFSGTIRLTAAYYAIRIHYGKYRYFLGQDRLQAAKEELTLTREALEEYNRILDRQLGSNPASADRNQDLVLNPSSAALRTEMATLDARIDKPN